MFYRKTQMTGWMKLSRAACQSAAKGFRLKATMTRQLLIKAARFTRTSACWFPRYGAMPREDHSSGVKTYDARNGDFISGMVREMPTPSGRCCSIAVQGGLSRIYLWSLPFGRTRMRAVGYCLWVWVKQRALLSRGHPICVLFLAELAPHPGKRSTSLNNLTTVGSA